VSPPVSGVSGDDCVRCGDSLVEGGVHRWGNLDDHVDTVRCGLTDCRSGVGVAVVDDVVRSGGSRQGRLLRSADGCHDGGSAALPTAPAPPATKTAVRQRPWREPIGTCVGDGQTAVRGERGDAQARAKFVGRVIGQRDGLLLREH
jgi:hypothetical protein